MKGSIATPKWDKDQSCTSLLFSSNIDKWLVKNICKSDTSAGQLKVPSPATGHIWQEVPVSWTTLKV